MTEAERLRAHAEHCIRMAKQTKDQAIAGVLLSLAATSFEKATELESAAIQKRQPRRDAEIGLLSR